MPASLSYRSVITAAFFLLSFWGVKAQTPQNTQASTIHSVPGPWLSTSGLVGTPRISYDKSDKKLIIDNVRLVSGKAFTQTEAQLGPGFTQVLNATPPQATALPPIHWRILIDVSDRSKRKRIKAQLKYATDFIKLLPTRDACTVILFASRCVQLSPTVTNNSERTTLIEKLESNQSIPNDRNLSGSTFIYEALRNAIDMPSHRSDMHSHILLLSDGKDEANDEGTQRSTLNRAKETNTQVHSVGFWDRRREDFLVGHPILSHISAETKAGICLQTELGTFAVNEHARPEIILERAQPYTASIKVDISSLANTNPKPSVRVTVSNAQERGIINIDALQIKDFYDRATPLPSSPATPEPAPQDDCVRVVRLCIDKLNVLKEQLLLITGFENSATSTDNLEFANSIRTANEVLDSLDLLIHHLRAYPDGEFTSSAQIVRNGNAFSQHEMLNILISLVDTPESSYQKLDILKALSRPTALPEISVSTPPAIIEFKDNKIVIIIVIAISISIIVLILISQYLKDKKRKEKEAEDADKKRKEEERMRRERERLERERLERERQRIEEELEAERIRQLEIKSRSAQLTDLATQKIYYIHGSQSTVGRSRNTSISLPEYPHISAVHCIFQQSIDGQWTVSDTNSENGLYINGIQLDEKSIKSGDTIGLGTSDFLFESYSSPS